MVGGAARELRRGPFLVFLLVSRALQAKNLNSLAEGARERSDRASQTFWLVGRGYLTAQKLSASDCEIAPGHVQIGGRDPGRERSGRRRSKGLHMSPCGSTVEVAMEH